MKIVEFSTCVNLLKLWKIYLQTLDAFFGILDITFGFGLISFTVIIDQSLNIHLDLWLCLLNDYFTIKMTSLLFKASREKRGQDVTGTFCLTLTIWMWRHWYTLFHVNNVDVTSAANDVLLTTTVCVNYFYNRYHIRRFKQCHKNLL